MNAPPLSHAFTAGDQLLEELSGPAAREIAPTMGRLARVRYTHKDMIDYIIEHPWASQNEIAARYGYTPAWISNIMASDAFQSAMASRREEVLDPVLRATIEERFKALVHQSLTVLMKKLEQPTVSDNVAIRAAELGAKALGLGGHAPQQPPAPAADRLTVLAERLIVLQSNVRGAINGEAKRVEEVSPGLPEGEGGVSPREGGGEESDAGESVEATVRANGGLPGEATV